MFQIRMRRRRASDREEEELRGSVGRGGGGSGGREERVRRGEKGQPKVVRLSSVGWLCLGVVIGELIHLFL